MNSVTVCETLEASPEVVFERASDFNNLAENISGITASEVLTPGPVGVGTRWRETRVMFGKEATEEMEITFFDAPHRYDAQAASHGVIYTTTFTFEPEGAGTRVTATFSGVPQTLGAKIMGALLGWMMQSSVKKCLRQDIRELGTPPF